MFPESSVSSHIDRLQATPSGKLQAMQEPHASLAKLLCLVVSLQRQFVAIVLSQQDDSACPGILKLERLPTDKAQASPDHW